VLASIGQQLRDHYGDEPRFEFAVQIPEQGEAPEMPAPAPVENSESMGTLSVVTTLVGAKVSRAVGTAPEVRVMGLPTDRVVELLITAPGFETDRELIATDRWSDPERPQLEINVDLRSSPEPSRRGGH